MFEFKLQLCCLLIVLYIIVIYLKATRKDKRFRCNRYFDALLIVIPWAIFFDGFTAYSVNHRDVVNGNLNLVAHCLFLIFMDISLILLFLYFLDLTTARKGKNLHMIFILPGTVSLVLILAFIKDLYYIDGEITSYSMGKSVYACYASVIVYYLMTAILLIKERRTIEKSKLWGIGVLMSLIAVILGTQIVIPQTLLTALIPTIVLIGIYIQFENYPLIKLHRYNRDMIAGFANLVETRDDSTGGHVKRTEVYVQIILNEMRKDRRYNSILTKDYINDVMMAAPMHDIGKVATPDVILQKPGKLTDEEYAIMKQHVNVGAELIKSSFSRMNELQFIDIAYEMAKYHHEKWNGRGYPCGLAGKEIPLHARIMAIADVFDAVSADRCYRAAMPLEQCFKIISDGRGIDFDPYLVDKFKAASKDIEAYYYYNEIPK